VTHGIRGGVAHWEGASFAGGKKERFSNTCALFSGVQSGFFLKKSHLNAWFQRTTIGEPLWERIVT
jgi:hypothetical protein